MSNVNRSVSEFPDHPDLPVKPPLVFAFAIVVGIGIDRVTPMAVLPTGWHWLGVTILALGAALMMWAVWLFDENDTAVEPWKPARVILDRGPYRFSRNPIYIGFALIQAGFAIWIDRLAVLLMVVPALVATHIWVVRLEERYLERKFGATYLDYRTRVRRWL